MQLVNGWTGGQYSAFRLVFGAVLAVQFAGLLPYGTELSANSGPAVVVALLAAGLVLSLCLAIGLRDRVCALALWFVWVCLFMLNPLIANPSLPFVGCLLLAHAALPRAPYGSWDARGRPDPDGGWMMSPQIFAVAWIVLALAHSYSGYTELMSSSWLGFELLFAPLALVRRLRPWLWGALLGMHLGLIALIDFADLSLGMAMLHGFTFDPAWVRARRAPSGIARVYYDGACGLCHRSVRFLLAEDRDAVFRFAPFASQSFEAAVPPDERRELPDSVVLILSDGTRLVRSAAFIEIGRRLGGIWRAAAAVASVLPAGLRDAAYDFVARVRHRLFRRPAEACPLVPPALRERFES